MKRNSLFVTILLFTIFSISNLFADKIREGVVLYKAKSNASASELKSLNALLHSHVLSEIQSIDTLGIKVIKLKEKGKELAVSKLLKDTGAVEFAEPDREITHTATPNDPRFQEQWHHNTINSKLAWDKITVPVDLSAVRVCVLDTGVDTTHPDLIDNLLPGYNANSLSSVEDNHGHGTGTAGVIGAVGNNEVGVAGVLWDVDIIPIQINISETNSSAYISTMAEGIRWCADQGAKVANLSYGGAQYSTIDSAATYLRDNGGLLFMSAGNGGTYNDSTSYPDWSSFVIVGATGKTDTKTSFSEYGPFVDIFAPGSSILTTYKENSYVFYSGTSFSSPMTAGLGAMLYGINPNFTPDEIENFIFSSAVDLGDLGDDDLYGHGRIDLNAAVNMALNYSLEPNVDPVAVLNSNVENGIVPLTVEFNGTSSYDNDGSIVSYEWNFGDGNSAVGEVVSHNYSTVGTYNATLTVTDNRGAKNISLAKIITVESDPSIIVSPSALTAQVDTSNVELVWIDNSDNETGFVIQRAKKRKGKFVFEDIITVASSTYTDTVSKTGDYKYRVKAVNSSSESEYSNEVLVKVETLGGSTEPTPSLPAPTLSYSLSQNSLELIWSACPSGSTCTYLVEQGDSKVKGSINFAPVFQENVSGTNVTISLENSGTYYFRVKAFTSSDSSDYSNTITVRKR